MSSFMLCAHLCHNLCPFSLYRFVVSLCHFLCLHLSHLYARCCTIIYAHYVDYKTKTSSFKIVLTQNTSNKEVDYMSYEKFITDFLNIKPSDLDKISGVCHNLWLPLYHFCGWCYDKLWFMLCHFLWSGYDTLWLYLCQDLWSRAFWQLLPVSLLTISYF